MIVRTCPKCGKDYKAVPALSRKDNKTEICPDCGTMEALDVYGCSEEEKRRILALIHQGGRNEKGEKN